MSADVPTTAGLDLHGDRAAQRGNPSFVWRAGQDRRLTMILNGANVPPGGRIGRALVDEEADRLRTSWSDGPRRDRVSAVLGAAADELDRFDRVQLEDVLEVCARARSLSAAGRELFAVSRR